MKDDIRIITHLKDIDQDVLTALKQQFKGERRIADRGAPFQSTDALSGIAPPSRRLVLAIASEKSWFIHYEHGGLGWHSHLVELTRSDSSWHISSSFSSFDTYDAIPKLRNAIREGKFHIYAEEL